MSETKLRLYKPPKLDFALRSCKPESDYNAGLKECLARFGTIQDYEGFMATFLKREIAGIQTLVAITDIEPHDCTHPEHVNGELCEDRAVACDEACGCCLTEPATYRVIGTLSFFFEKKFIHDGGLVGHIEDVCVALGYESSGVGSALVTAAKGICQIAKCYKIILDCSNENMPFYQKLGFRHHENCMRIDLGS